jgi:two-component system NarL family response regulator
MAEEKETSIEDEVHVLIADDHPTTRTGIRRFLEGEGFIVCAEAEDAQGAIEAARRKHPDLCLLDVDMPGSGIAATHAILRDVPASTVVILNVSESDEDLFGALAAGAAGYLLKGMDPDRLTAAVRGVLHGEAALPRTLVSRLVQQYRDRDRRRVRLASEGRSVELTSREWEVLDMVRAPLSSNEMAQRLDVSPVTVRRHVSRLLVKLQATPGRQRSSSSTTISKAAEPPRGPRHVYPSVGSPPASACQRPLQNPHAQPPSRAPRTPRAPRGGEIVAYGE